MEKAPLFEAVAEGPPGGAAWWLRAADGVRIRIGVWPKSGARGTVFLFSGRTEYVEKYGRTAADLAARGYAMLSVDWRGQGLADRATADRAVGHVDNFSEYQLDVAALTEAAAALSLPRPWHMLAHSMGGCIGLRTLMGAHGFEAVAFSAPMWGLLIAPAVLPFAWMTTAAAGPLGLGHLIAPGTAAETYVKSAGFEGNLLTRDPEMYAYMQRQVAAHPELALGGPSMTWVYAALRETRSLSRLPAPDCRAYTALGTAEQIVETTRIKQRMAEWPGSRLELYQGAEHEIPMELPVHRNRFLDRAVSHFEGGSAKGAPHAATR